MIVRREHLITQQPASIARHSDNPTGFGTTCRSDRVKFERSRPVRLTGTQVQWAMSRNTLTFHVYTRSGWKIPAVFLAKTATGSDRNFQTFRGAGRSSKGPAKHLLPTGVETTEYLRLGSAARGFLRVRRNDLLDVSTRGAKEPPNLWR